MHNNLHLTPREQEIMSILLSTGANNKQISKSIGITESTVKQHVSNLLTKYCAKTRSQLILFSIMNSQKEKNER